MRKQVPAHCQPFPAVRDAEHTFLALAGISSAAAFSCTHTPRGIHGLILAEGSTSLCSPPFPTAVL